MNAVVWDILLRCSRVHSGKGAFWYEKKPNWKRGRWWLGNGNEIKLNSAVWLTPLELDVAFKRGYLEHSGGMYQLTREGRAALRARFGGRT